MKKIAVFLLCFSMLAAGSLTAYADEPGTVPGQAVVSTEVPSGHVITVIVNGETDVTLNGQSGSSIEVERLSEPKAVIVVHDGFEFVSARVLLDGEDITDRLNGLELTLPPVYKDKVLEISIETKKAQTGPSPAPSKPLKPYPSEGRTSPSPSPGGSEGAPGTTPDGGEGTPGRTSDTGGSGETPSPDTQPAPAPAGGDNPATGIAGGVSIGTAALLALGLFRRKHGENE